MTIVSDRICEVDGHTYDTYDNERYWHCGEPGEIDVEGTLMCLDHAGERGYGPRQENWGYDPDDGLNPTPDTAASIPNRADLGDCQP